MKNETKNMAAVLQSVNVISEAIEHYYIPKKLKIAWDGCYLYCPTCGNEDVKSLNGLHQFCNECGQRLGEIE